MGPKTKYSPGDIVRVRDDLVLHAEYYMENSDESDAFVSGMDKYSGCDLMIAKITGYGKYNMQTLEGEFVSCNWTDEMFEDKILPEFEAESMESLFDLMVNENVV